MYHTTLIIQCELIYRIYQLKDVQTRNQIKALDQQENQENDENL